MNPVDLISKTRSGVMQISLEHNRQRVGNGSGFLVSGGFITNSHVIGVATVDAIALRFEDGDPDDASSFIRLLPETRIEN
jgi:S1-C subfamily serine protease